MEPIEVPIDGRLFSDDTIARAAHRYTGEWSVRLARDGDVIRASFTPLREEANAAGLAARFDNDLLDERLREHVRAETLALHAALLEAALRQAAPAADTTPA